MYEIQTKEQKFNLYESGTRKEYTQAFNDWVYENSQEDYRNYTHFFTLTFRDKRVTNGIYAKSNYRNPNDDGRTWLLDRDWNKAPYKVGLQRLTKNLDWLYMRMKEFSNNFVIVTEEGSKKGRLHLHGLFHFGNNDDHIHDLEWHYEKMNSTFATWQQKSGFVKCEKIKDHKAVSQYVTKYMTKDIFINPNGFRMFNKKIKNKEN